MWPSYPYIYPSWILVLLKDTCTDATIAAELLTFVGPELDPADLLTRAGRELKAFTKKQSAAKQTQNFVTHIGHCWPADGFMWPHPAFAKHQKLTFN